MCDQYRLVAESSPTSTVSNLRTATNKTRSPTGARFVSEEREEGADGPARHREDEGETMMRVGIWVGFMVGIVLAGCSNSLSSTNGDASTPADTVPSVDIPDVGVPNDLPVTPDTAMPSDVPLVVDTGMAADGSDATTPCRLNSDCPRGQYCGTANACTFDCREDLDCLGNPRGTVCDIELGRCVTTDGGPPAVDAQPLDASDAAVLDSGVDTSVDVPVDHGGTDVVVDTGVDAGCGVCSAPPNATSTCSAGVCGFTCLAGYGDCDGVPTNGCETSLSTSAHCGTCATACASVSFGTPICTAGVCGVSCTPGYHACGGTCADSTSTATCGTSCSACAAAPANATANCTAGTCGFACNAYYHLCGGACVSSTAPATCGASCTPCTIPANATAICTGGTCGFTCNTGYTPCGGACIATATDPTNCGTCGHACAAPAHGSANCASGTCGFVCDPGYASAGAACALLAAPRQIAPLSTSTVTSRRPTLHWSLPTGATGAHVTLCRNRALTTGCASFDATSGSGAPTADLAAGVWFWQLTSRAGTTTGTVTSPAWEFTVGARTATIADTSWGTTLDVNGDGYADLVVGAGYAPGTSASPGPGRAYVYLGSASGLATTPATTLTGPDGPGSGFGNVASAGDVNGDGFADLVVGAGWAPGTSASPGPGRAYVYLGSASGLATTPATTLTGPDGAGGHFDVVASAGDVNGDGYADVVVAAYAEGGGTGAAHVYLGSASGLATTPATTLTGPDGAGGYFGASVASVGDVNGDGYADLVVGAYGAMSDTGRAYIYLGSASGLATTPTTTLTGPDGANNNFGASVASAGDVNGDGYADVVVGGYGSSYVGRAHVYLGSATGLGTTPATTLTTPPGAYVGFGISVASAGDVNGDGYADVVVGAYNEGGGTGAAHVYLGSASGLATTPATTLTGLYGSAFGIQVASAGDVNGDGYADVAVAASYVNAPSPTGQAFVFLGSAGGLATTPATTLTGPDGAGGVFGGSVASVVHRRHSPAHLPRRTSASPRQDSPFACGSLDVFVRGECEPHCRCPWRQRGLPNCSLGTYSELQERPTLA